MNILEFKEVCFSYDNKEDIIQNLSFSIDKNSFISIIGASGCGKSTIFKLMLSLIKQQSGYIYYDNRDIHSLSAYAGYMPQKDLLFPWKNVKQNLEIPLEIRKVEKSKRDEEISKILETMGLSNSINKMPYELSGGMRQRVSFARTILTNSNLLLFDEPLSALDYITRIQMQSWLLERLSNLENKTAIFITHDVEEAIFLSDTVFVITEKPITKLNEIKIDLPKNRTRKMLDDTKIIQLKNDILEMLKSGEHNE